MKRNGNVDWWKCEKILNDIFWKDINDDIGYVFINKLFVFDKYKNLEIYSEFVFFLNGKGICCFLKICWK